VTNDLSLRVATELLKEGGKEKEGRKEGKEKGGKWKEGRRKE